jgi:hypothetical protein
MTMTFSTLLGQALARYLSKPRTGLASVHTSDPALLALALRPGDVLLVDGDSRLSTCIKYLTQSNWSHSALYIGDALGPPPPGEEARVLIEADINDGVRAVPLSAYTGFPTRICRPLALREEDRRRLVRYAVSRIGHRYDLQNVIDLARYLLPVVPVPARMRRRLLAFGSGDPTRAICSTLIAQAFQSIGYPVLPRVERRRRADPACRERVVEILYIRHHSLYAPRDSTSRLISRSSNQPSRADSTTADCVGPGWWRRHRLSVGELRNPNPSPWPSIECCRKRKPRHHPRSNYSCPDIRGLAGRRCQRHGYVLRHDARDLSSRRLRPSRRREYTVWSDGVCARRSRCEQ